ncbi:MAG: stealth family protein [Clostridium sp.]
MEQKIDFVIAWVDGNDKKWIEEKARYSPGANSNSTSFNYQNWDNLHYWFRAVEKFTPWVNNIYFITWGHIPSWLNINHPKLRIVNHKEFIPEKYLPTFSSHTIELNLHRIKGLSEHFVYFNDDTFILKEMKQKDFFKRGLPRDSAVVNPIAPANKNCIASLQLNNIGVINENFKKKLVIRKSFKKWFSPLFGKLVLLNLIFLPWNRFVGLYEMHLPSSFLKQSYIDIWDRENEILDQTCEHKFRYFKSDVNQWVIKEWQLVSGNFFPRSTSIGKLFAIKDIEDAKVLKKYIIKQKKKMICVNDHVVDNSFNEIKNYVNDSFKVILPDKCGYEL